MAKLVLCFVLFFYSFAAQVTAQGDQVSTESSKPVDCVIDKNRPKYVPNIYQCASNEDCCINEGQNACCAKDISSDSIKEQAILWGVLIAIFLIVGIVAVCYFRDNYFCGGDPDDEEMTVCCCIKRKKKYKKKINVQEKLYPDEAERYKVDDPIFGPTQGKDVPTFAAIDDDTFKRAQHM